MTNSSAKRDRKNSPPVVTPAVEPDANKFSNGIPSAEQCAAELMEAMPAIMQFIRAEMRSQSKNNLSIPQFRVLAFLSRQPGASLSEVADHLGVTRATASTMTDRLVKHGYVDRSDNPQERRHINLKLTESGSDRLQEAREAVRAKIANSFGDLTTEQLTTIFSGLTMLHQKFKTIH